MAPTATPGRRTTAVLARRLAAQLTVYIALGGCGQAREDPRWTPAGEISILRTIPEEGSATVPLDSSLDLCLDGVLDPRALEGFEVLLTSGGSVFDTEVEIALSPYRAPGRRDVVAESRWCPGSVIMVRPTEPLIPGVTYRLRLAGGPHGWDAELLDTASEAWNQSDDGEWTFGLSFRADPDGDATLPLPDLAPTSMESIFAPGQPLDPTQGTCSCHQEVGSTATAILNLRAPSIAATALTADSTPRSTGFPMVSTGYPAASYLIQRLVDDERGGPLHGTLAAHEPSQAELDPAAIVALSTWIATGASAGETTPPAP